MSLKEEFQKLVHESRKQLDKDEIEALGEYEAQKARFGEILPILDDLRNTIEENFIRIEIDDDPPRISARIYVGNFASERESLTLRCISPIDDANGEPEWLLESTDHDNGLFETVDDLMKHMMPTLAWEIAELQKEAERGGER